MSKHCAGCRYWEKKDKESEEYKQWKETNECEMNFDGSSAAMEPESTFEMFKSSLDYNICCTRLISDGDSKTHAMLLEEQPYGTTIVVKCDCVGHVQKKMGTTVHNLKSQYRGQKLADGKTFGRQGRPTDSLISNSVQNIMEMLLGDTRGT